MVSNMAGNALALVDEFAKPFASPPSSLDGGEKNRKTSLSDPMVQSQPLTAASQRKSLVASGKLESSGEIYLNIVSIGLFFFSFMTFLFVRYCFF